MKPFLLLDQWPMNGFDAALVKAKIFLKEGVWLGNWHDVFKNRSVGGSISVPRDLIEGLAELDVPFERNRFSASKCIETAVVFKDPRCLDWAVRAKRAGRISRLFAGPIIVTVPDEAHGVMMDPAIDGWLFTSEWHRDLFLSLAGEKHPPAHVWFAGVDTDRWLPSPDPKDRVLVYQKSYEPGLLEGVVAELDRREIAHEVLVYGRYDRQMFQSALGRARLAIFLSRSETQGLAMFEAWSSNVPTLHWNPGIMRYLGKDYTGASSCAYLTSRTGFDFRTLADFPDALDNALARLEHFDPRNYVLSGFTRRHSIERFLNITQEAQT